VGCDTYLICKRNQPIELRHFRDYERCERICVDQLANPDTVTFAAGGIWTDEIILEGCVATVSDSQASQELMRRFQSAIKKAFRKVKAFYVGPKAQAIAFMQDRFKATGKVPTVKATAKVASIRAEDVPPATLVKFRGVL
jgi:hypothetical protein